MDSTIVQIVKHLRVQEYVTAAQLASALHISERTVRTKIGEASGTLERNGATISSKRRLGYQLEITEQGLFDRWMKRYLDTEIAIPKNSDERVKYILSYLLKYDRYIKLDDLSQTLYISRNTVTADLKRAEGILKKYNLNILRRPNYGIRLEGTEFDRRVCIAQQLLDEDIQNSGSENEMRVLQSVLSSVARELNFRMTSSSFRSMVVYLYVSMERLWQGYPVVYSKETRLKMYRELSDYAMTAARKLSTELTTYTGILYDEDETICLAIYLTGKTIPETSEPQTEGPEPLKVLVEGMLAAVYEGHRIDLRADAETQHSLLQHLVPLDTRLRFNIPLANPILDSIKAEYAFAFMLASTACMVLQEYYGKEIPQDEVGYIAILLALAIEKQEKSIPKKNIVIVCTSGRATSRMFLYKCKQAFGDYVDKIYERTVFELPKMDYEALKIDLVFTTIPLDIELPVPIYLVSPFLDNQEVEKYQCLFEYGTDDWLSGYFDPRLFLSCLKAEGKENVLEKMCRHAAQFKNLGDDFYEQVLKREAMGQTDFGNLVAIPHTYRVVSPDKFVMVALLDKPIWWGHNDVQIVFLISLPESSDSTVENFCRMMLNLQSNEALARSLIQKPSFSNLMRVLREADQI